VTILDARLSGRLREVVACGKNQQNTPNAGLIDQFPKDMTLSAKIRSIETKLFDFFFSCNNFREKYNRVYRAMCLLFDHCHNSCLPQDLIIDIFFVC